jgi:hypothetical protein
MANIYVKKNKKGIDQCNYGSNPVQLDCNVIRIKPIGELTGSWLNRPVRSSFLNIGFKSKANSYQSRRYHTMAN